MASVRTAHRRGVLVKKTGPNIDSLVGQLTICLIKLQKNNRLL